MPEQNRKTWRELCHQALEAENPRQLMEILQEFKKTLKREQVWEDFRKAIHSNKSAGGMRC
jgi:hypothetical protein